MGVTAISPWAVSILAMTRAKDPDAKPVSRRLVTSCACSRSSTISTATSMPRRASSLRVVEASRSASSLVAEGWRRPPETTTSRCSGTRAPGRLLERGLLLQRCMGWRWRYVGGAQGLKLLTQHR